ncbi:MAG: metal-dependent hydrolase [Anaerolineae bacterium]
MIFGHLAVSALEHRYAKAEFIPVMAAAVLPDVVDKVSHYVLGQGEVGRLWGHTLIGVFASTLIVLLVWGKRWAASWALGYLSHLVCDIGGVVPLLHPFVAYEFPPSYDFRTTLGMGLSNYPRLALETALSTWAFAALRSCIRPTLRHLVTMVRSLRSRPGGERGHGSYSPNRATDQAKYSETDTVEGSDLSPVGRSVHRSLNPNSE